mgnify:CR=1 FL=1
MTLNQSNSFYNEFTHHFSIETVTRTNRENHVLTYGGRTSSEDPSRRLEAMILISLENALKELVDPHYMIPSPPESSLGVIESILYDPMAEITLQTFQDFLNRYYTEGTLNVIKQAKINIIASKVFPSLQHAVRYYFLHPESNQTFSTHAMTSSLDMILILA